MAYAELLAEIRAFLEQASQPAVVEPGEVALPLVADAYSLELDPEGVLLEAWSGERLLRRRLKVIRKRGRDRLELLAERFPRRRGTLTLLDAAAPKAAVALRENVRSVAREQLRHWCERLRPAWHIDFLSSGADLENTLSPRFPRALLRMGSEGICAIAAPDEDDAGDCFSFGLIWLDYARQRWPALRIRSLLFFVPEAHAGALGFRLLGCNQARIAMEMHVWLPGGGVRERSPRDWGNTDSAFHLRMGEPPDEEALTLFREVAGRTEAECVQDTAGGLVLELRGLPLAAADRSGFRAGLKLRPVKRLPEAGALCSLADRVARYRRAEAPDGEHPLYRAYPERWLESVVRQQIREIDPTLHPARLRRQVTGNLGLHSTRTDLLGLDNDGRLVILELKASEDVHLVAQALDYQMRLRLQLQRREGDWETLFPGMPVSARPPRVLLIAPSLSFHPANETVLRFLESSMEIRQIGLAIEWRKKLRVMFDHSHAQWQRGGNREWLAISSIKSGRPLPR